MLFSRKKESDREKEERLRKARAEMQSFLDNGKIEYDEACKKANEILSSAEKPQSCNVVRFASISVSN